MSDDVKTEGELQAEWIQVCMALAEALAPYVETPHPELGTTEAGDQETGSPSHSRKAVGGS